MQNVKEGVLKNQFVLAVIVFLYCVVYGITAQFVLTGLKMAFFLSSLFFALLLFYILDPHKSISMGGVKSILTNKIFRDVLLCTYTLIYGVSSVLLFSGFDLVYFLSSYIFALCVFYICGRAGLKEQTQKISSTSTVGPFNERHPCFINSQDLSWLIRELNGSLSTVIGFTELMLRKQYTEGEKEYMQRIIYTQALTMSNSINKAATTIPDSPVKPKEIYEVVDLLDDKNFK